MSLPRIRWHERQTVQSDDLQAEQDYRIDLRRRHNLGHHGWGVVRGMALVPAPAGVVVEPGLAVDGYGREILLPARLTLSIDTLGPALAELGVPDADRPGLAVWVLYSRNPSAPERSASADPHRRWHEECRLRLTAAAGIDPARPPGVADDDFGRGPHQSPVDDPAVEWPVYLGEIEQAPGDSQELLVDLGRRRLASLIGSEVRDPAHSGRLRVVDPRGKQPFGVALRGPDGVLRERLTLDRQANASLHGSCRAGAVVAPSVGFGDPTVSGAVPGLGSGAVPAPGTVDRHLDPESGRQQLRWSLQPQRGEESAVSRLSIGPSNAPSLTVGADRKVWAANLKLGGRLRQGPIPADPQDARFASAVTESWLDTLGATVASKHRRDPETIRLDLMVPEFVTEGESVPFTVTLRNPGVDRLEDCRVFLTMYPSSGDQKREVFPTRYNKEQPKIALEPDQWLPFQGESEPVSGTGLVLLRVEAVGFIAGDTQAQGLAEAQVEVFGSQDPPSIP